MDRRGSRQLQAIDNKGVAGELHGGCTETTGIELMWLSRKRPLEPIQSNQNVVASVQAPAGVRILRSSCLRGFTPATIALAVQDMDVREGRPAQNLSLSGGVNVNMAVWRPLEKIGRTDEELAIMYKARMKMDGAQDGPHNQIESKSAIDAEIAESGASNT